MCRLRSRLETSRRSSSSSSFVFVLRCLRPSSRSPSRRDCRSRRRSRRRRSSMASRSSCLGPLGGPVWEGPKTSPKCSGLQIGPDPSQIDLFLKEHIRDFGARPDRRFWALRPVGFWRCLFSCFLLYVCGENACSCFYGSFYVYFSTAWSCPLFWSFS